MPKEKKEKAQLEQLESFLKRNKDVDINKVNLLDSGIIDNLDWKNQKKHRDEIIKDLKGYQRLMRIVPGADRELIFKLLENNITSALEIAIIPKLEFITNYSDVFGYEKSYVEQVYSNAREKRSRILVKYMEVLQNSESHVKKMGSLNVNS